MKKRPKVRRGKAGMCPRRCGHEMLHHNGPNGECTYGANSIFGPCGCEGPRHKKDAMRKRVAAPSAGTEGMLLLGAFSNFVRAVVREELNLVRGEVKESGITRIGHDPEPARPRPFMSERVKEAARLGAEHGRVDREILTTLAQWRPHHERISATFIAIFTGYSVKSGSFGQALARLRSQGWIEGSNKQLGITQAGLKTIKEIPPLPSGEKIFQVWRDKLDTCSFEILHLLYTNRPRTMTAKQVAEELDYSAGSGSFGQSLAKLRKLELIAGTGKDLRLHDAFAQLLIERERR